MQNNTISTSFINTQTGEICYNIWDKIDLQKNNISIENFEYNNLKGVLKRNEWKPFLDDWLPLYDGLFWNKERKKIDDIIYTPNRKKTTLNDLILVSERFFNQFKGKHIGVQLSGGLDSSIVIGLLHYLKIPFSLVGMRSDRYEFRTERIIQDSLYNLGVNTVLIDYERYLPLSDIMNVPRFPYPDLLLNNFSSEKAMIQYCKELGIEVLLTGGGGDNVFAEPVPHLPQLWRLKPQVFTDGWSKYIYATNNIELCSFYAEKEIIDCIYNLRLGQKEDNLKLWARNTFKDFLPQKLVNYTYCADFWGLYISGLQQSLPSIRQLFERVYHTTNYNSFSPNRINVLLEQDYLTAKKEMYQKIEARIAFAVWLNSLYNNK